MDDLTKNCGYCKMRISDMNPGDCFVRDKDGVKYRTFRDSYNHGVCFFREGDPMTKLPSYVFDEGETVSPFRLSKETLMQIKDNKMIDIEGNISIQNIYKRVYGIDITDNSYFLHNPRRNLKELVYLLQEFKLIEAKYKYDFVYGEAKLCSIDFKEDFESRIDVIFDIKVKWTKRVKEILDLIQEEIKNESSYARIIYARKEYFNNLYDLCNYLKNHAALHNYENGVKDVYYISNIIHRAENFGIQFKKEEEKAKPKEEPKEKIWGSTSAFLEMLRDYYIQEYGYRVGEAKFYRYVDRHG